MRRLIAGLLLGCFLTLIGLQSAHRHRTDKPVERCSVCALAQQATRQAPKASPAVVRRHAAFAVAVVAPRAPELGFAAETRARAPPPLA